MTTDEQHTMLELAAKAAGIEGRLVKDLFYVSVGSYSVSRWNPLESSADCGELEAKLFINVKWFSYAVIVSVSEEAFFVEESYVDHNGDRQAARRLAVTRLAAKIGETQDD